MNQKQTRTPHSPVAALLAFAFLLASPSAFAACTSPSGNAGDIVFSSSTQVMAYCNGSGWINMGATNSTVNFGTLTTGDFCLATSATQITCTTAQVNLATQVTGTLPVGNGGTGLTSITTNGIIYGQGTGNPNVTAAGSQYNVFVAGASGVPSFGQVSLNQSAAVSGQLGVANGGTGAASLTQYGVILGNGTGALGATAAGATGTVLIGNTGANPSFSASPTVTNITLSGAAMLQFATDYTTTGTQQDVAINGASAVRYAGASAATFQGVVAGTAGQILIIHNASSATLTLSNQSGSEATVANRIITGTGVDLTLSSNSSASLQYDGTASRWRVTASSNAGAPAGSSGQIQFNSAGTFDADSNLSWDNTNKLLAAGTAAAYPVATTGTLAGVTVNVVPQGFSFTSTGNSVGGGTTIGNGASGQLTYYSGGSALAASSSVYWDSTNGRLGIGTAAPSAKLQIYAAGNPDALWLGTGSFTYPTTPTYGHLVIRGGNSDYRLDIQDGNGRVNQYWNAYTDTTIKYIVSSEQAAREQMSTGTTEGSWAFYGAPTGTAGNTISWTQGAYIEPGNYIWFSPRGTSSDFFINNSGYVGIGTVGPVSKLQLSGTFTLSNGGEFWRAAYWTGSLWQYTDSSVPFFAIRTQSANVTNLAFGPGGTSGGTATVAGNIFLDGSTGNVGIGSSSPGQALSVNGTVESTSGGIKFPDATVQATAITFTPWVNAGAATIGGTSSAPTKGTNTTDRLLWRRVGDSMELNWNYIQTAAGGAGSGSYFITIPGGYSIDTTKLPVPSSSASDRRAGVGTWHANNGTDYIGSVYAYDATHLWADWGNANCTWGSSCGQLSSTTLSLHLDATFPISGWSY